MKKIRLIAILIAALVVAIPIAHAQELSVTITGKDGGKNFLRPLDTLSIKAQASIPGESIISKDQVRIYLDQSFAFMDNCTAMSNSTVHNCIFTDDSFVSYQPLTFNVELRNDDDRVVKSERQTVKIDSIAPVIQQFNATPSLSTGQVSVKYTIAEFGNDPNKLQDCSGIKTVEVRLNNNIILTDPGQIGVCTREKTTALNLNESGNLCIRATDFVGQRALDRCQKVLVDKKPPLIDFPRITNTDGTPITHVRKGEEKLATISVRITDDSEVDPKQVFANLAAISPAYKDFAAPQQFSGEMAVWRSVPLLEPAVCKIAVRAKDKLGGQSEQEFACQLRADNNGPAFVGLVSERFRNNVPLLGRGSSITVEFEDKDSTGAAGAGMNRRLAYLDLSELGLNSFTQANTCEPKDNKWRCTWQLSNIQKPEGTYTITVAPGTADDLGNVLSGTGSFEVVYDDTAPQQPRILKSRVVKGEEGSNISAAVAGNYAQYVVTSSNFTDSFADFSDLGGKERSPGVCGENENGTIECTFESIIEFDGPYTAGISFQFLDDAGNNASTNTTLEIKGIDNATSARYWSAETECSPKLIDRGTATTFPPYVSCKITLKTPRKNITTLSITGADPTQCAALNQSLVLNDAYLSNNFEGSTTPFLNLKLESKEYFLDAVNITCPISIMSQRAGPNGSYVSPSPQVIPIRANVGFYGAPESSMYNEIDEQIMDAMSDGLASQEWLGQARKIIHYAEVLCQIKTLLANIIQIIDVVAAIVGFGGEAATGTGVGSPAGETLKRVKTVLCNGNSGFVKGGLEPVFKIIDPICSFIHCDLGKSGYGVPGVGLGGGTGYCEDIQKFFNTAGFGLSDNPDPESVNFMAQVTGNQSFSIKDSLVWSSVCLCLPGIVYNLEKLRQVQCYKAVCLNDKVKTEGYPASMCNEMYNFLLCQYVVGQVFAAIPFANFFNKIVNLVIELISNPMALFTLTLGFVCAEFCEGAIPTGLMVACTIPRSIALVGEAVTTTIFMTKTKGYFSNPPGGEYCKRMEKIKEDLEGKDEKDDQ